MTAPGARLAPDTAADQAFLAQLDLSRPALAPARRLRDAGDVHGAALAAARLASEGPLRTALRADDVAATRDAIRAYAPGALAPELRACELWLQPELPKRRELDAVDEVRLGVYTRVGRARGNETLILALAFAMTGERRYADAAIAAMLKLAATFPALPQEGVPPAYDWHPKGDPSLVRDIDLNLQYWMTAWPILDAAMDDEQRLAALRAMVPAARGRMLSVRHEIPFNLTLHPLLGPLLVAIAFPAIRDRADQLAILRDKLERDFADAPFVTPDGYTREGSAYHGVNNRLVNTAHLAVSRGLGEDWPRLREAAAATMATAALFVCPDGSDWIVGDGYPLAFHEPWIDHHEALHLGAVLHERPEWKALAGSATGATPHLLNLWLMGPQGIARWATWPAPDVAGRVHRDAHADRTVFHVLRAGRGVDGHAGILCFGSDMNHCHHDKGQALVYGYGRHLLSDFGHPGFPGSDMVPGFSAKVHGCAHVIRRTPTGPRTDHADQLRSIARHADERISIALAEHALYENHVVQRALALVTPDGREANDGAFWLVWDRVVFKRGWPGGGNVPMELIETAFPFHAPACDARIARDGRSVWSRYDGPDGAPYLPGGPTRAQLRAMNELSDSDANLQVTRLESPRNETQWDIQVRAGATKTCGNASSMEGQPSEVPRPIGVFRYRGFLPHVSGYVLVPFRGVRDSEFAVVSGAATEQDLAAEVRLPSGTVRVRVDGLSTGHLRADVARA